MKNKYLIFIMIFLLIPYGVNGDKIQENETWEYINSKNNRFNEKAISVFQKQTMDGFIALVEVNTTRPYTNNPSVLRTQQFDNIIVTIDFDFNGASNRLFITQEGGMPLFSNEKLLGTINFNLFDIANSNFNVTGSKEFNHSFDDVIITGKPSRALATAETEEYGFEMVTNNFDFYYKIAAKFLISTNQAIGQKIRNYTITPIYKFVEIVVSPLTEKDFFIYKYTETLTEITEFYQYSIDEGKPINFEIMGEKITPKSPFSLNSFDSEARLMTFDSALKQPTYIRQTEPVEIRGLSLSQEVEEVEYFLVRDEVIDTTTNSSVVIETTTSASSNFPFFSFNLILFSMGILIIIKKIK